MRLCLILLLTISFCTAQQLADTTFDFRVSNPRYAPSAGPRVIIDEAHHNFHTASGRYLPFACLLRADGYQVVPGTNRFSEKLPARNDILVIANATDGRAWILPTLSSFTAAEIDSVKSWVLDGGRLLLIADHMPMAGAADSLARAFGFGFYNGFAFRSDKSDTELFCRAAGNLVSGEVTDGFRGDGKIDSIVAFTGQGFSIPGDARPIMLLGDDYEVLLPDTAWRFSKNTPRIPGRDLYTGAYIEFGKGRVVVFGEAAMFTAQVVAGKKVGMNHPAARYNAQLLLNVMHWLSDGGG